MAEWLGGLLANFPLWVIILVSGLAVIIWGVLNTWAIFGLKNSPTEWWTQQYGKKKETKHGKK